MSTIYGSNVSDTILTTACKMSTTTGGTETSNTTTIASTSNPYAEIRSQGGASTAVAALPAPTGNGWIWWCGAGSFAAGNWSAVHTHSSVSKGVNTVIRFYKYSSGTYTSIGSITVTNTATAKTTYTFAATAMGAVTTGSGDGIYVDLWWFDNNANAGGDNPTNYISNSGTAGVANDMQVTTATFTPSGSTVSRTVPATAALQSTTSRTVPSTVALQSTNSRVVSSTVALQSLGNARTVPATGAIANTKSRTIPSTAALTLSGSRTVPATAALQGTVSRTVPASAALQSTGIARTIPASAALLATKSRTVPASASLANTVSRTVPSTAALQSTISRTVSATVALTTTRSRTIPVTTSLTTSAIFYASNIASSIGGLTQSDQMSQVAGGVETSFTVTMPASGTNSYVELLAQGGSSSGTSALPAPTGKGWSISLAGNTILAGSWSSAFTLAKSGTTKTGATLVVRYYRRTMDGTYYPIGVSTLTGQSFSTTKTTFTTPAALASWPWQFINGDTLYMDAFVFNAGTAWASDVFTVYVSNSATQGVYNDGIIIAPMMVTTPAGLNCLVGTSSFQTTNSGLPVRDQSFTLADALDQRSILSLTGEDAAGTLSYQRGQPVQFSDHDQGLLYTGAVNSDKVSKVSAGSITAQTEHQLTFMDNHYAADKRANTTNYLNWSAGDMVCDFIQQTLSQEGVTGAFALESDYTPTTFVQGTLSGTVATTTTGPFTYAPNTAAPPITSNTGDLELTRSGTQFTLTEETTSDFASGTLTNMTATSNSLQPTTQSALKVTAELPLSASINTAGSATYASGSGYTATGEYIGTWTYVQIWSGSKTIAANDTFNYDVWIASTSPAYLAGVDFYCSDGTQFTLQIGNVDDNTNTGLFDQNSLSVDVLTDLSGYAKDAWYTRNISIGSLSGKTITNVSAFIAGSAAGYYTAYVKNIYLSSASGSPFFSTSATAPQLNPPTITTGGGYLSSAVIASVVSVYRPVLSTRISPSHSISGVGLVQSSTVSWTASLPTNGPSVSTAVSPYTTTTTVPPANTPPSFILLASYDGSTWLPCANNEALPGLPAGANVSGLSLYLNESFAAGSDPSAIPSLLQINITINSAAAQTTTDVVAAYGNATTWNTGTYNGTGLNSSNDLTQYGTYSRDWANHSTAGQIFTYTAASNVGTGSDSASSGKYVMTLRANGTTFSAAALSRLDFAGTAANFTIEFDIALSDISTSTYAGLVYRGQGLIDPITTTGGGGPVGGVCFNTGYAMTLSNSKIVFNPFSGGTIFMNSFSSVSNPFINVSQSMSSNTTYHVKYVIMNNRHTLYWNHATSPVFDVFDNTSTAAGGVGFFLWTTNTSNVTATFDNFTMTPVSTGTWTSPSIALTSLGTCGNTQVVWNEENATGATQSTAMVVASLDGGSTWQQCTNGATIPGLTSGTNVSGKSLLLQVILYSNGNTLTIPIITGLYARICGNYGTVTGTRISPALSLTPVGYVDSSNVMWNANVPTSTTLTVATSQDASTWTNVGNNGAGASLTYWTNQPDATQDLFATNTLSNYTSTNKSGGSVASVTYDTADSNITLVGGSSALYLNNAISTSDVDLLVDMDESDAGGLVWRKVDASNFYELGVYDASSSGGFTNQLRLYKVSSGTRTLLGSASSITFTRGTFHRIRVTMQSGLINVYWDGTCKQSYLDTSPLAAGACGIRNDGGTSRYYQLWIQPLGTNLSGQVLYTKVTMTTSDPSVMPQLFALVACVRGPSIATGATISQLHPITTPFATYYANEMDTLVQASGDYYWYIDKWKQLRFGPRLARPGAFPVQSVADSAGNYSGYLLYQPTVTVLSSADLYRNQQVVTNVTGLVTPPTEVKVADGNTTSWTLGYPVYSAPVITVNGQTATVGIQGIDNNKQFYWQPGSASISYDSTLPKLPSGTILNITYVGESTVNVTLNNSSNQTAQAAMELNSGIVSEIESALRSSTNGMTTDQATTFGNGLLARYGTNNTMELVGTTLYAGLAPGTVIPLFLPEIDGTWNAQLPIVKLTTTAYQSVNGIVYIYAITATNGPGINNWARAWFGGGR